MSWLAISEEEILDSINKAYDRMSIAQRKLWEVIKVSPQKWQQEPYGDEGEGFWVVAIFGNSVIWFNDIEKGYNTSSYSIFGTINEYRCNQDELEWQIQNVINQIKDGYDSAGYSDLVNSN